MTRISLVAIAGLAGALFPQPVQAYQAPWCAMIQLGPGSTYLSELMEVQMLRTAAVARATPDWHIFSEPVSRWKHITLSLLLVGALGCLPMQSQAAGIDCPELGLGSVPNLLNDLQVKLIATGDSADLANEISDLVNKLQILKPNISYAELTNVIIAAFCPVVASTNLTAAEKWDRMRQFDRILQRQLAADTLAPGTLIIANVPLPPAVYRELHSQAAKAGQKPAQFMAAILGRAAGN